MKCMKSTKTALLLLLLTTCITSIPLSICKTDDIQVVSYSYYISNIEGVEVLDIAGEIKNVGSSIINSVSLTASAYTADGTLQGEKSNTVLASNLLPQQSSPFYLEIPRPYTPSTTWSTLGISRVTITINEAKETGSYQYQGLEITSSSAQVSTATEDAGTYWVTGSIKNNGTQTSSRIWIVGTFYNSTGQVVAISYTNYLTPTSLAPTETTTFKIGAFDLNQSQVPSNQKITSYQLLIQMKEPILQGDPPTWKPSTISPNSSNPTENNPTDQNLIYAAVIAVVIVVIIGILIVTRKRKTPESSQVIKQNKKQVNKAGKRRIIEITLFFLIKNCSNFFSIDRSL